MTPLEFADKYLGNYSTHGDEIVPDICPLCGGGSRRDKGTFALSISKQTFNCKRGKCKGLPTTGRKEGTFQQLCSAFGERGDGERFGGLYAPKIYAKPKTVPQPPTDKVIEYIKRRGLVAETIERWRVSSDGKGNIVFPYYGQGGELEFVKFRPAQKINDGQRKMWRESGTRPILYGMWQLDLSEPIITLCAGEFDAMALSQCGVRNVLSIPSGDDDDTWIDECWDMINRVHTVVLAGDTDDSGRRWTRRMIAKLGESRCLVASIPPKYKDANEMMFDAGCEALLGVIEDASPIPISGIRDMADIEPKDMRNAKRILTGINSLDYASGGLLLGQLTTVTGRRGEGKSTLVSQIMCNAIENGEKVCVFSGELSAERFQAWIHYQLAGEPNIKKHRDAQTGGEFDYVEKETAIKMREWYRGKVAICDNEIVAGGMEQKSIMELFEYAARRFGCRLFVVDNLMTARFTSFDDSKYFRAQGNFVAELSQFTKRHDSHVLLVAHPKKAQPGKGNAQLENDDISGSGEIPDRSDNVLALMKGEQGSTLVIRKWRERGWLSGSKINLDFSKASRRFYEPSNPVLLHKIYGWEKEPPPVKLFEYYTEEF